MVLFIILLLVLLLLTLFVVVAVSVGGTAFIIVFGDIIVCIGIIAWIIKRIIQNRKK